MSDSIVMIRRTVLVALAFVVAFSAPSSAELFTVTLNDGTTFETQYRPKVSPDFPGKALMLTNRGNWIALQKDDIVSVVSEIEARGFGMVINTTTISLGLAPNERDLVDEGSPAQDPAAQLLNYLTGRDNQSYSVQQFVEPSETGGIPLSFSGSTTAPIGAEGDTLDLIDN